MQTWVTSKCRIKPMWTRNEHTAARTATIPLFARASRLPKPVGEVKSLGIPAKKFPPALTLSAHKGNRAADKEGEEDPPGTRPKQGRKTTCPIIISATPLLQDAEPFWKKENCVLRRFFWRAMLNRRKFQCEVRHLQCWKPFLNRNMKNTSNSEVIEASLPLLMRAKELIQMFSMKEWIWMANWDPEGFSSTNSLPKRTCGYLSKAPSPTNNNFICSFKYLALPKSSW